MAISEYRRRQKAEWKKNNPEKVKAESARYRAKHKEALKERDKRYYQKNAKREKAKQTNRYQNTKKNHPEKIMYKAAKYRATRKGIAFNITVEDIKIPTHCPVFGLPLYVSSGQATENSPSLDRINSKKGYTKGNIIVISNKANHIKNCGTPDEHIRIGLFFKAFEDDFASSETIEELSVKFGYQ